MTHPNTQIVEAALDAYEAHLVSVANKLRATHPESDTHQQAVDRSVALNDLRAAIPDFAEMLGGFIAKEVE